MLFRVCKDIFLISVSVNDVKYESVCLCVCVLSFKLHIYLVICIQLLMSGGTLDKLDILKTEN